MRYGGGCRDNRADPPGQGGQEDRLLTADSTYSWHFPTGACPEPRPRGRLPSEQTSVAWARPCRDGHLGQQRQTQPAPPGCTAHAQEEQPKQVIVSLCTGS